MPFPIMGVNTDNGPDYVNETLDRRFAAIFPGAARSRSRPYCKNDNAHTVQRILCQDIARKESEIRALLDSLICQ